MLKLSGKIEAALLLNVLTHLKGLGVGVELDGLTMVHSPEGEYIFAPINNLQYKIAAIKALRNVTGMSLSNSKAFVENGGNLLKAINNDPDNFNPVPELKNLGDFREVMTRD